MQNIQTLDDLDTLFADHIQSILGLRSDQVRISYATKGQKAPKMGETVIYIHTQQEQDDVQQFKNRGTTQENTGLFTTEQSSMRRLSLVCSIYGNDCDVIATQIKERFYFENTRMFLEQNNLALLSERTNISNKIHELINERWWERVDLAIGLYSSITVDEYTEPFEEVHVSISSEDINVVIGG